MEKNIFESFSKMIYRESGIVLPPEKINLLSSRIQRRMRELDLSSEGEYLKIIELDLSGDELARLIDAVSTNVTYFYREESHFQTYRDILLEYARGNRQEIRVWCAAASSGEEPYTLAFEAAEIMAAQKKKLRILATDICSKALDKATAGVYPDSAVAKIPVNIRSSYMTSFLDGSQTFWRVKHEIASSILFKKLNLVSFPYPVKGPFDIIFCRNVMIYFDRTTRAQIIQQFSRLISPGGSLFLSHSENLLGIEHDFEKIGASVFRKRTSF